VEISRRLQRPTEPLTTYLTELQTLLRRHGNLRPEQQLSWMYRNLLPDYRLHLKRTELTDTVTLLRSARKLEALLQEQTQPPRRRDKHSAPAEVPTSRPANPTRAGHRFEDVRHCTHLRAAVLSWRCGQTGHFRRECTRSVKIFCSRCRKDGVMSKDCPCQTGNASGLCALEKPVPSPPTPPNDRPFTEESDHRPHVTVQILGELHAALVDTGAAGSFIGDHTRDKCNRHLRPANPTIQSARMANDQVDAITEAYWISLKVGTTTIRGKFHYLPHLPSDIVLGIDILRRYPFTIDLEKGSASLRAPAAVKTVQPTPAHPALQISDNSPPTLSIGTGQRRQQPLPEGAPRCVRHTEVRREMERSPTAHRRKPPVPKPAGAATPRTSNDAVHHQARPAEVGARFREEKQR
jgi:hypothetical protein